MSAAAMIDLILFGAFLGTAYGGFWLGSKYSTVKNMGKTLATQLGELFK